MSDDVPPPPDVAGVSLSGTEPVVITAAQDAGLCRSTGVEPASDGTAHPAWYFVATQIGMGKTVAGLCAACDFDVADGPMMGGTEVSFARPIRLDTPYRVEGEIKSLIRKRSKTFGAIDLMEYQLRLVDADGPVLTTTNSWALPRRNLA